ncbi:tautomerase family protein [Halomonas caseinilytica]|nr:2-hydroxymuconate tautomerase family protein [Halomonas caseinilytica]
MSPTAFATSARRPAAWSAAPRPPAVSELSRSSTGRFAGLTARPVALTVFSSDGSIWKHFPHTRGDSMPIVNIQLIEGRSAEQKEALIEKVTAACVDAVDCTPESVRILLSDVTTQDFGVAGESVAKRRAAKESTS